ncbi:MAG: nitrogenase-stabilizing/protective protein NifW [Chromatiales bacterium]|jgi:nitrogenase-stabilizing/protective protein
MTLEDFKLDLDELSSAEDFLHYFRVAHDPTVVQVNRLHILQRFHDYLEQAGELPEDADQRWAGYADRLERAYQDFVASDARTEKVFRVFRARQPESVSVPLSDLMRGPSAS